MSEQYEHNYIDYPYVVEPNEQKKPFIFSPLTEAKLSLLKAESFAEIMLLCDIDDNMRQLVNNLKQELNDARKALEKY